MANKKAQGAHPLQEWQENKGNEKFSNQHSYKESRHFKMKIYDLLLTVEINTLIIKLFKIFLDFKLIYFII